ncbi:MAG: alpha/beta hydrolase [Chloroflexota bacterium]
MSSIPTLQGITSTMVQTSRINQHVLMTAGEGAAIIFIHGNCSSATFWEETMLRLPDSYVGIAPDQRGYGETEPLTIDATQGLDDMAADILALAETLGHAQFHLVGHSMGGNVVMKIALMAPAKILSMTLVATGSPYGYSGSKGADGEIVFEDGAPAGGGSGNPDFVRLIAENERGEADQMAPRNVMRAFYYKPPFVPEREEDLLSSLLSTKTGDAHYPGNFTPSENWPGVAPGTTGILNALARKYYDASSITEIDPKPPVLWIRGADDMIVADNAMFDVAALGAMGAIPGHPGVDVCPPQPMIAQTRAVLEIYAAKGGDYTEVVMADTGHTPYIEKPAEFDQHFHALLGA